MRIVADAYGLDSASRCRLVKAILDRQTRNAQWWRSHLTRPRPRVAGDHLITERVRWSEREYAFTEAHRETFAAALR